MAKKKKLNKQSHRNMIAAIANLRSWGSGHHGDKKKEGRRGRCRKKVVW
jgi:hypothetical protein